jgi:hypothetical protein
MILMINPSEKAFLIITYKVFVFLPQNIGRSRLRPSRPDYFFFANSVQTSLESLLANGVDRFMNGIEPFVGNYK